MINKDLKRYLTNEVDMYTKDVRDIMESELIPAFYDIKAQRRSGYLYKGYYKYQSYSNKILFLVKNLPVNATIRKEYKGPLSTLINSKEIRPFFIFLGRRMIKWSNIEVIMDQKNTYLYISSVTPAELERDLHCLLLPSKTLYEENTDSLAHMCFDIKGRYMNSLTERGCTSIELPNRGEVYMRAGISNFGDIIELDDLSNNYRITKSNVFVFIQTDYGKVIIYEDEYDVQNLGFNMIKITSEKFKAGTQLYYLILFRQTIKSKDIQSRFKNSSYAKDFSKKLDSELSDFMNERFQLMNSNSLENAMQYDSTLLDNYFISKLDFKDEVITGKEFKSRSNRYDDNIIRIPTTISGSMVMVFKNRKLYLYNKFIKVKEGFIEIPVIDINDSDKIEIIYFLKVNNYNTDIIFDSNTDDYTYKYEDKIPLEDAKLFCELSENEEYNISGTGVHYEAPTYKVLENNQLMPGDHFYFDKKVTLTSRKRFAKYSKIIEDDNTISITLPSSFDYCNEISKYMIFIDGLLINKEWTMITLANESRPFNDITVYFDIQLNKGQQIDIFYLPINISKVDNIEKLGDYGFIRVDGNKLNYNMSKELHFVFLNGRKLLNSDLINVKYNTLRLNTNIDTVYDINIYKVYNDEPEIEEMFKRIDSRYDQFMNLMSTTNTRSLYSQTASFTSNSAVGYTYISKKAVLYEIIRKYYLLPSIYKDKGEEIFNYDFEGSENFMKNSDDSCTLFTYLDANLNDKFPQKEE